MKSVKVNITKVGEDIKVDEIVLTMEQAEHLKELLEATIND